MILKVKLGAVAVAAALLVGACAGDEDRTMSEGAVGGQTARLAQDDGSGDVAADEDAAGGAGGSAAGTLSPEGLPDALPASAAQAQVIRTAELRIELKKGGFREAFERATFLASAHQGFVLDSSSERSRDGLAAGSVVLRVPTEQFDSARKDLATLGKVRSEHVKGEDVGGQLVDLEARLKNLRAQEESLRVLMERAASVPDTMQVQQNLFGVRTQIEQLAAQEARLKDGVAFATIRVAIAETGAALLSEPEPDPSGIAGAFAKAVDGAIAVVSAMVIAVGYLLPLAVLLGLAYLALRLARRPEPVAVEG